MAIKEIKLILKGNPISNNSLYKAVSRGSFTSVYMTKEGKELKESYSNQVREQYDGEILSSDLYIEIDLFFGDKRKRDYDNFGKLINDALTGIVWTDDSQVQLCGKIEKHIDKENPRIELLIKERKNEN